MHVVFIRADCFYILELPDDDDIEAHVRCNPGTVRVERLPDMIVLWPRTETSTHMEAAQ